MLGNVRDIAIIILAVESIVIGALLVFLIVQLQRLIRMLREELKPILNSTQETVSTVRGTTTFLSEHLVSPLVQVISFFAGIKRASQLLVSRPKGNGAQRGGAPAASGNPPDFTTSSSSPSEGKVSS